MRPATGAATTYLDFGLTQGGRRTAYDYYEGQHAYDLFMGARYLHDLIAYRNGDVDAVHHPEDLRDNLRKYVALATCAPRTSRLSYYEIGSSVFGVIDALNYLDQTYKQLNTSAITWFGVDNSRFMNHMARYTHEDYDISVSETVRVLPCDVFFAKGVSLLYALHDESLFCDVLASSRLALFDYTFSRREKIGDVVGTGLPVTFLSLNEIRQRLEVLGKTLILEPYTIKTYHQSAAKVTYDCVYGDADVVAEYASHVSTRTHDFERDWNRPLLRTPAPVST
jgi:hypothetical protein